MLTQGGTLSGGQRAILAHIPVALETAPPVLSPAQVCVFPGMIGLVAPEVVTFERGPPLRTGCG